MFQVNLSLTTSSIAKRTAASYFSVYFQNNYFPSFLGGYITLAKKFHKPLLKKGKQRFSNKKDFIKNFFKVNEKKTRAF